MGSLSVDTILDTVDPQITIPILDARLELLSLIHGTPSAPGIMFFLPGLYICSWTVHHSWGREDSPTCSSYLHFHGQPDDTSSAA